MSALRFESVNVGDALPEYICGPVSRTTLAWFAGGSGDHNPIHLDIDFARKAGMKDVFVHGMLSMAYLAQMLTRWAPQTSLREYGVRFISITPVNATMTCTGKVVQKFEEAGEQRVRLEVKAKLTDGTETLVGDAVVGFNQVRNR